MTKQREILSYRKTDLAGLGYRFKLLFFLSDLGITGAHSVAVDTWNKYLDILTDSMAQG